MNIVLVLLTELKCVCSAPQKHNYYSYNEVVRFKV